MASRWKLPPDKERLTVLLQAQNNCHHKAVVLLSFTAPGMHKLTKRWTYRLRLEDGVNVPPDQRKVSLNITSSVSSLYDWLQSRQCILHVFKYSQITRLPSNHAKHDASARHSQTLALLPHLPYCEVATEPLRDGIAQSVGRWNATELAGPSSNPARGKIPLFSIQPPIQWVP